MRRKTILITGAATGFGRGAAELLAGEGHRVFAGMRDPAVRQRAHALELQKHGVEAIELDVTDPISVDRAVARASAEARRIDVLVNNAGVYSVGVTEAFTPEEVRALFEVNVFGLLRVTRAVLPLMRRQREGLVINVGSIVGRLTFPFMGVYGASKFALEALSDSLRYELSQLGVEVALVQPSAYPTPMHVNVPRPADAARAAEYGELAKIPGAMLEQFATLFRSAEAPDPREVAETIAELVAQPRGERPARTVVGAAFGADVVNARTAPVQEQAVESFGLGHLAKLA